MTHRAKSLNFIRRSNKITFLPFNPEFSNFVANWQYESYEKIQNFSSISLKLCLLGQKNTGTWGVNNTIGNLQKQLDIAIDIVPD